MKPYEEMDWDELWEEAARLDRRARTLMRLQVAIVCAAGVAALFLSAARVFVR